jgi:hypothetical protein
VQAKAQGQLPIFTANHGEMGTLKFHLNDRYGYVSFVKVSILIFLAESFVNVGIETIFGKDVDDVFAYTVPKYAKIRDARLGVMQYCFMIGILLYVVISSIVINLGYLAFAPPSGLVQFTLEPPSLATVVSQNSGTPDACCASKEECTRLEAGKNETKGQRNIRDLSSNPAACSGPPCIYTGCPTTNGQYTTSSCCYSNYTDLSRLPYCTQYQGTQAAMSQRQCGFFDGPTASSKSKNSIFISTSKTVARQIAHTSLRTPSGEGSPCGCPSSNRDSCTNATFPGNGSYIPGGYSCSAVWHTESKENLFVANAEAFVVYVNHVVQQYQMSYQADSKDIGGWLQVDASENAAKRALQDQLCQSHTYPVISGSKVALAHNAVSVSYNGTGSSTSKAPCLISPGKGGAGQQGQDFFSVRTLLQVQARLVMAESYSSLKNYAIQLRIETCFTTHIPFSGLIQNQLLLG